MRITLADVKASRIPQVLGVASCDSRFLAMVNEATQRLVMGPEMWWECYQRYKFRVSNGRLTWPRQVAAIWGIAVDDAPYTLHNEWFEYLGTGYGVRESTYFSDSRLIDRGTACVFDDIITTGNDKTIKLYSTVTESTTEKFIVRGYDEDGIWIRTQVDGTWVDGEHIQVPPLSSTPRTSAYSWSAITDIIKPITNGELWLYERDTVTGEQRRIGLYESDETRPRYRRSLVGGVTPEDEETSTQTWCITAMVKREFIPVRNDNDFLIIGNLPALKEMCQAIQKRETGNLPEAQVHEAEAFRLLDREASHYIGRANTVPLKVTGDCFGMGDVLAVQ